MKHLLLLAVPFLMATEGTSLRAQSVGTAKLEIPPFGFEPDTWGSVLERWIRSEPVVVVYRKDGGITGGQPVRFTSEEILIYPETGIPLGEGWQNKLIRVPVGEVNRIAFQRGGIPVYRSHRSSLYSFPEAFQDESTRRRLESASIYQDSVVPDVGFPEAFRYSRVLRQVYPRKWVRFSAGLGMGGNLVTEDLSELLRSSPIGPPDYHHGTVRSIEVIDIGIRFADRFVAGWQYVLRSEFAYLSGYHMAGNLDYSYHYRIGLSEHRFYGEYAIFNVDRFFIRRFELLAGAGFLLARPWTEFSYYYYFFEEPDTYLEDNLYNKMEATLPGVQFRAVFHYFLLPGLSIFTGLEMNLYRHWDVPELELPTPFPGQEYFFPAHELVFNALRFKIGIGFFL